VRLLAVDPGLANAGLVLFEGKRIADVRTCKTAPEGPRPTFTAAVQRGEEIARQIREYGAEIGTVDVVVAETYVDMGGGHLRMREGKPIPNRWTTPLAIGLIIPALRDLTEDGEIVWQPADIVMTRYGQYKRLWALGQTGVVTGDIALRNDHLRSAAAHGLFYLDTRKAVRA
jgi:hypothetical protein